MSHVYAYINMLDAHFEQPKNRAWAAAWSEVRREMIHARGTLCAIERSLKSGPTTEQLATLAEFAASALAGTIGDTFAQAKTA